MLEEAERKNRKQGSGTYERNKCEEGSSWRKDKYHSESTRRVEYRLNTKSSDHQKHSDETQHGRNHRGSKLSQTPKTDGHIQYRKHDKQSGHSSSRSRYSEMSWAFQKPKEETDISGREDTSRQEFARKEVDSVFAPSSHRNPTSAGNWRKKESERHGSPNSPTSMKPSSCEEAKHYTKTESLSASSPSDSQAEEEETADAQHLLTDKEMNDLGAKLVKAEILGNEVCLYVLYMDVKGKIKVDFNFSLCAVDHYACTALFSLSALSA